MRACIDCAEALPPSTAKSRYRCGPCGQRYRSLKRSKRHLSDRTPCPRCGKLMGFDNKDTVCWACRRVPGRHVSNRNIHESSLLMLEGVRIARLRGHVLTAEPDSEPGTWVACCDKCGMYVCVDVEESRSKAYGLATTEACYGTPRYAQALRRNLWDLEYGTVSAGGETADRKPPYLPEQYRDKT